MKFAFTLFCTFSLLLTSVSQSVRIDEVRPEKMAVKGFSLGGNTIVEITGTGGVFRDEYRMMIFYGWILDANTRKVVWHLFDEFKGRDFKEENGLYDFKAEAELPAGDYELYFTGAYSNEGWNDGNWTLHSFGDLLEEIFDSRNKMKYRWGLQDDLFIEVEGTAMKEVDPELFLDKKLADAAIYYIKAKDDERFEDGFTLSDKTTIRLYALGEGRSDEIFDYLWIYEAGTGKRVYEMNYRNTSFAGGARKNLKADEEITLEAGSYLVNYVTDDSHSFEAWNALPPDDPQFWGVTVFPATESDKANFVPFDPPKTIKPVAQVTRVRDNELLAMGFSLKKEMDIRVLCLGEQTLNDDMVDYGWIVDAKTRETVWRMRKYRSEHAGGASKNRRAEEVITLPAGEYIAYYTTDGSHSYRDWNAARPLEEELWGISVFATKEADLDFVEPFNPREYKPKNVITEIVMVEDDEYYREYFTLEEETKVVIMAMGEGRDGRMFDFGWIKSMDTGRMVWEMDYHKTEPAGGSRKNRMIREEITLPAGEYRVYYETDGSHSFDDWNADPPTDPQSYGIRVLRVE